MKRFEKITQIIFLVIFSLVFIYLGLFLVAGIFVGVLLSCIYYYLKRIFYVGKTYR